MNKISSIAFLGFCIALSACKSTQTVTNTDSSKKPNENLGFYQFSNEDPTASPFFAKKSSVYGKNGMVAATHPVASQVGVTF